MFNDTSKIKSSQGTLSLNAAIFAAVLLASRLQSNEKVFGLVLFALELFAFLPLARLVQYCTRKPLKKL